MKFYMCSISDCIPSSRELRERKELACALAADKNIQTCPVPREGQSLIRNWPLISSANLQYTHHESIGETGDSECGPFRGNGRVYAYINDVSIHTRNCSLLAVKIHAQFKYLHTRICMRKRARGREGKGEREKEGRRARGRETCALVAITRPMNQINHVVYF